MSSAAGFPTFEKLELRRLLAAAVFNDVFAATQQKALLAAVAKAPKKPAKPDLQAASDDGARNNDDVTSVSRPVFDVDKVDANMTVQLLRNGVVVASVFTTAGGTVSLRDDGPLALGTYEYTARMVNAGVAGDLSPGLKVTIVAPATPAPTPPASPSAPDLNAASDSGSSNADNLTASSTLGFTIGGVASGLTVRLMRDGAVVASGVATSSSITLSDASALTDGSYSYTAMAVGSTGLASGSSAALAVVVDRTAPDASAPDLAAAYDFGRSDSDDLTSATSLSFEIAAAEMGAAVELVRGGVSVASASGTGGMMTLSDPATLADGAYGYSVRVTDAAGNMSTSGTLAVTVDATAPAGTSTPDLIAANDLGRSDSDNVTPATSLSFEVTGAEDGAMVELLRDGVVIATATGAAGVMQMADPATLVDGVYSYSTRITDAAGNSSVSGALAVTVDTTAPGATSAPVLTVDSDLGIKGDNMTRDRTPTFMVSGAEPYALVQLIENDVVIAEAVAGADGTVAVTPSTRLTAGMHNVNARQTDAAGNTSAQSATNSVKILNALASSDFDGDGISDIAIYTAGTWTIQLSSGGTRTATLGGATDVPIPGDYDGDGLTDIAIYRPSGRSIRVIPSSNPDVITVTFISTTFQVPVPADYDGDGKTDAAVYNNATGVFTIIKSTGGTTTVTMASGVLPAVADYDGDGKADVAVFTPATGAWEIMKSTGGTATYFFAPGTSNIPMPADYDGDGFADPAFYLAEEGEFHILGTTMGEVTSGLEPNSIPLVGDFDGDNMFDPGTYTQAAALFTIFRTTAGPLTMSLGTIGAANQPLPLSIGQVRKDVLGF